jgi:hypothetical protein
VHRSESTGCIERDAAVGLRKGERGIAVCGEQLPKGVSSRGEYCMGASNSPLPATKTIRSSL